MNTDPGKEKERDKEEGAPGTRRGRSRRLNHSSGYHMTEVWAIAEIVLKLGLGFRIEGLGVWGIGSGIRKEVSRVEAPPKPYLDPLARFCKSRRT